MCLLLFVVVVARLLVFGGSGYRGDTIFFVHYNLFCLNFAIKHNQSLGADR